MGKRLTDEERARRAQKRRLARQRKRRAKPQKRPPEPKGKDRKKKAEGAGVPRTIEQYLKELEAREAKDTKQAQAIEKAADKARNFPTAENIEAVAELQDAAMLAEEQAQQAAIGAQRKAIEAGKESKWLEVRMVVRAPRKKTDKTASTHSNNLKQSQNKATLVKTDMGEVRINPAQIKFKMYHAKEFGIDRSSKGAEAKYLRQVIRILKAPDMIKRGHYSETTPDAIVYQTKTGEIVIIDAKTLEFVTCFKRDDAHKDVWLDNMQPIDKKN